MERYNRTVHYDWLSQTLFDAIAEVYKPGIRRLWMYNGEQPNMAIGGIMLPIQNWRWPLNFTSGES